MKFNITKKQWESIGITHGWKKQAQKDKEGQFVLLPSDSGQQSSPSFVHPHYAVYGWDFNELKKIMKYLQKNHPNAGKLEREAITVKAVDAGISRPLKTMLTVADSGNDPVDQSKTLKQYTNEDRKFIIDKDGNKQPIPIFEMTSAENKPTDVISIVLAPQIATEDFKDQNGEWKRKTVVGSDGRPEKTGKTLIVTVFPGGAEVLDNSKSK
jgi:hypothetical protein